MYPQAAHALLAAQIAVHWGNADVERPPLPFDAFVRGVALHDRGYGELDADPIGAATPTARWVEIQFRSFEPRGEDPIVDLVVAMHVRRLVSWNEAPAARAALAEMTDALPAIRDAAGIAAADADAADAVTDLCDRVSFDFCFEEPASGRVGELEYTVDGMGGITVTPWPLGVPWLAGIIVGFHADGYPERLGPVAEPYRIAPRTDPK